MSALATLHLCIDDTSLFEMYTNYVHDYNDLTLGSNPDSGFDLFVPSDTVVDHINSTTCMVSMGVRAQMTYNNLPSAYYLYPRSSLSKTPLMLANHVGVIDSGYTGLLIGAFRNLSNEPFIIKKHSSLLQICHPSLCPILVKLVTSEQFDTTLRGEGGFGSTGRT